MNRGGKIFQNHLLEVLTKPWIGKPIPNVIEKRLLNFFKKEIKEYGLTSHIKRYLEDEELSAKVDGVEPHITVEEFDKFMNEVNDE